MNQFDVVIVGAGLSGIGAAAHLRRLCPGKTFAILEARDRIGGTWDLFRYPGIRSDSDMFTLGYKFKPWLGAKAIADGASIRDYIEETAREEDVERHIRFGHRIVRVAWSSETARWAIEAETEAGAVQMSARFLIMGSGYYRYDAGYTPHFKNLEAFEGEVVHPQHWPEQLAYAGKNVVVIGSGATAVTLIPELAKQAAKVTMLQRSPTYVLSAPATDAHADWLRAKLPKRAAAALIRAKKIVQAWLFFQLSKRRPAMVKRAIRKGLDAELGANFDIDTHFTPRYDPWDQRMCLVPDADMFAALRSGAAEVVTDSIDRFDATGVQLASGRHLDADIVVTATGLQLQLFGGIAIEVDGQPVDLPSTYIYKGAMVGGVPNLYAVIGYNNASWTLKADLTATWAARMIEWMDRRGFVSVTPVVDGEIEADGNFFGLNSNYLLRSAHLMPQQGKAHPWRTNHNYFVDYAQLKLGRFDDGVLQFGRARAERVAA